MALDAEFDTDELREAEAMVEASSLTAYDGSDEHEEADEEADEEAAAGAPCSGSDLGVEMLPQMLEHMFAMHVATPASTALAAPAASLARLAMMASRRDVHTASTAGGGMLSTGFILLGDAALAPPITLLPAEASRPASPLCLALIAHPTANRKPKRAARSSAPAARDLGPPGACEMAGSSTALVPFVDQAGGRRAKARIASVFLRLRLSSPSDIVLQPASQQSAPSFKALALALALPSDAAPPSDVPLAARLWAALVAWGGPMGRAGVEAWQRGTDDAGAYLRASLDLSLEAVQATQRAASEAAEATPEWLASLAESCSGAAAAAAEHTWALGRLGEQLAERSAALAASAHTLVQSTGVDTQLAQELAQLYERLPSLEALRHSLNGWLPESSQEHTEVEEEASPGSFGSLASDVEAPPLHLWLTTLVSAVLVVAALLYERFAPSQTGGDTASSEGGGSSSSPSRASQGMPEGAPPFTPLAHILQPWIGTASTLAPSPAPSSMLSGVTVSSVVSYSSSSKPWRQQASCGSDGSGSATSSLSVVSEATHAMAAEARALLDAAVDDGFENDINPLVLFDICEPAPPPPPLSASKAIGMRRASLRMSTAQEASTPAAADPPVRRSSRRIVQKKVDA